MNKFHIHIAHSKEIHPSAEEEIYLKGTLIHSDSVVSLENLGEIFNTKKNPNFLMECLNSLNGFYCWAYQKNGFLKAGVDHTRSLPLFYGVSNGHLYLSDSAEWVREKINDLEMDPLARDEFLLAGYVTGKDTLYPNVKQLQAGEYLEAFIENSKIKIKTQRYYRFWHTEPEQYDVEALHSELERVTFNAMRRLITYANGRQIVIPLSGGYDSRLLASMLKKFGYTNVLCFTYGVPGNKEAIYSQQVAYSLGFKWVFVEYSAELWKKEWATEEAEIYRKFSSNHVSLPHVQDWPAIKKLVTKGIITQDAVLVPGHSGDFVAGSHIPSFVFTREKHSESELLDSLIKNHLSNSPISDKLFRDTGLLEQRLRDRIGAKFDSSAPGLANLYELWDWQERQSKYIINSVRVYEQFSLDWWLPLWDIEFVKFWERVPLVLRKDRDWFKKWIVDFYASQTTAQAEAKLLKNASENNSIKSFIFKIANSLPAQLKEPLKKIWLNKVLNHHFLGFEGLITDGNKSDYLARNYNIIGIYSELYIKGNW